MSLLDNQTNRYYQDYADEIFERYESAKDGISQYFNISFPATVKS